jgi:hypothetical protein
MTKRGIKEIKKIKKMKDNTVYQKHRSPQEAHLFTFFFK